MKCADYIGHDAAASSQGRERYEHNYPAPFLWRHAERQQQPAAVEHHDCRQQAPDVVLIHKPKVYVRRATPAIGE